MADGRAPRVLVVEDESLVAMLLEDMLADLGCEIVGSCGSVRQALEWLETGAGALDGAVLDVNLAGELVFPVADVLAARRIAFVFATGYGAVGEARFDGVPVLAKPVVSDQLGRVVRMFAGSPSTPG